MFARLKSKDQTAFTNAGFRRYAANTSWMLAEQMLRMVAGLMVGIWVARYLGPEQFGVFSYAVAFAAIFGSIAKLGLDSIMVRDLVSNPEQRDIYLGTAFWMKMMGAVFMLSAVALALNFTSNDNTTKLYIFIIASGAVFQSFEVVDFYFQSKVLSKFVSICKLSQLFISSLLKLYFIYTGSELFWFVIVSLVDQLTLAITLYLAFRHQKEDSFFDKFSPYLAKNLMFESWPILLSGLVIVIYMRIDQIMIKEILGAKDVGIYSAAVKLAEGCYFIPVTINNSLFPAIVNAKKISEENYYFRLQQLYVFMIWMALTISLLVSFLGEWIILTLYGPAYIDAVGVLIIHVWTGIFVFFGSAWSKWMLVERRVKMFAFFQINAMIFNIILNILLIPRHGIQGAALSTLIAAAVGHTLLPLFIKSQRIALKMFILSFIPSSAIRTKK